MAEERTNQQLSNITAELAEQTVQDRKHHSQQLLVLKSIAMALGQGLKLDQMRDQALKRKANKPEPKPKEETKPRTEELKLEDPGLDPIAILGAVGGAIAGLAAGIVAGLGSLTASLTEMFVAPIIKGFGGITKVLLGEQQYAKIAGAVEGMFTAVLKPFKMIGTFVAETGASVLKGIKGAFSSFVKLPAKIAELVSPSIVAESGLVRSIKAIGGYLEGFIKPFAGLAQEFSGVFKTVQKLPSVFGSFFKVFKVFGKAIAPIIVGVKTIIGAFEILSDETSSAMDKAIDMLLLLPKVIGEFFFEIPDMIKSGISWAFEKIFGDNNAISKFLDSFDFAKIWVNAVDSVADFLKNLPENMKAIGEGIASGISDAIDWVKNASAKLYDTIMSPIKSGWEATKKIFEGIGKTVSDTINGGVQWVADKFNTAKNNVLNNIQNFIDDPVSTAMNIIMGPANLLKDSVAWIMSKIGFDDVSETLKQFDFAETVKNIMMAPARLLKKSVSWALSKMGFGEDGTGEGDTSAIESERSITEWAKKIVLAPWNLLQQAWNKISDMISFDNLKSSVSALKIGSITDGIKEFGVNFLKAAVNKYSWLKYIPGVKSIINETGPSGSDLLQEVQTTNTGKSAGEIADVVLNEIETRNKKKTDRELADVLLQDIQTPTRARKIVSAQQANDYYVDMGFLDPNDPRINPKPAAETGSISGLAQESVMLADQMRLENERLQNSRVQQTETNGGDNNMVVADNSVNSYTNYTQVMQGVQPPAHDNSDPFLFYRSAGNPR